MRPAGFLVLTSCLVCAAFLRGHAQTPQQTFRTGTDVVLVDVSVRENGRAVTGLNAAAFELRDNGVRQRIDSVEVTSVPIDFTLVVDLSANPHGQWGADPALPRVTATIQAEIGQVAKALRPNDRLRLLAIDTRVQQVWPMQPVSSLRAIPRLQINGMAAVYDTLAAALLQPVDPSRRHVVIARTKGVDTISSIDAEAVKAIAERSDALFYVVAMETAADNDGALRGFQCELMGYCWPTRRFWLPFQRRLFGFPPIHPLLRDGQAIALGAEATGGGLYQTSMLSEPTLTGTFRRTLEDFRNSYVLRYSPQGVDPSGWHTIDVRVPRARSYEIRSRRGYLIETPVPAATPPAIPEVPRTLKELTTAYERGAYRQVVVGLRQVKDPVQLLREFEDAGNPWPATPRKEAAFALELAEPALFADRTETRAAGRDVLERFTRLIRQPLGPDLFERYWHFAVLTMLEGAIRPSVTEAFVTRALKRFPDEPRFILSRAIVTDQRWARNTQGSVVDAAGIPTPEHVEAVRTQYLAAMAFPETSVEARLRYAWFLHRLKRHDEALKHLTEAAALQTSDPALRYLGQLFLGDVLTALGLHDEAVIAYRGAVALEPKAQSGRVALMNALLLRGDQEAAEKLAEDIQAESDASLDPWWMYVQGQYRVHQQAMARLRELSR